MQLEFWRCTEKASSGRRACAKVCHRRKSFAKHLTQAHGVTDTAALEKRCVDSLNRRNFESLFWCGFCQQAVPFKQDDGQGLSERFDHIDAHFTGKGGRPKTDIGEWKSLETEPPGTFQDILGEPREPEEPVTPLSPLSGKRTRDGDADDDEDAAASGSRKRRYVKLGPRDALLWICVCAPFPLPLFPPTLCEKGPNSQPVRLRPLLESGRHDAMLGGRELLAFLVLGMQTGGAGDVGCGQGVVTCYV